MSRTCSEGAATKVENLIATLFPRRFYPIPEVPMARDCRPTLTLTHEVMLVFAHDQDRTRSFADNLLGVTAFEDVAQPFTFVCRDDDQIDAQDPRHRWNVGSRFTAAK